MGLAGLEKFSSGRRPFLVELKPTLLLKQTRWDSHRKQYIILDLHCLWLEIEEQISKESKVRLKDRMNAGTFISFPARADVGPNSKSRLSEW